MSENKPVNVTSTKDVKKKVSDVEVFGNPDVWVLLCKVSSKSQGWMKSTKVMETPAGCLVQTSTQMGENVAEALCFVPGVTLSNLKKKNYGQNL